MHKILIFIVSFSFFTGHLSFGQETILPEKKPDKYIEVAQVPTRSEIISAKIQNEYANIVGRPIATQNKDVIDSLSEQIDKIKRFADYVRDKNYNYKFLERFVSRWQELDQSTLKTETILEDYSTDLQEIREELRIEKELWISTIQRLTQTRGAPMEVMDRADKVLEHINSFSDVVTDSLNRSLNYQNELVDIRLLVQQFENDMSNYLEVHFKSLLFEREQNLYSALQDTVSHSASDGDRWFFLQYNFRESRAYLTDLNDYRDEIIFFVFFVLLIFYLRSHVDHIPPEVEDTVHIGRQIFDRPVVAAIFFSMILSVTTWNTYPPIPVTIGINLIIIVSFLILAPKVLVGKLRLAVYLIAFMFILIRIGRVVLLSTLTFRLAYLGFTIALILFLVWFTRSKSQFRLHNENDRVWFRLFVFVTPVFSFALIASIVLNAIGYIYLSLLITATIIDSIMLIILLGVINTSLNALLVMFVYTKVARTSIVVRNNAKVIISWGKFLFKAAFFVGWVYYTLSWFYLIGEVNETFLSVLNMGFTVDEFEFTIAKLLSFVMYLFLAWAVANIIRLLLRDELLSRFKLPKGVPVAVGSLSFYFLISCGVFVALMALGFDMQNLGIIFGALGVGIGFGLQNIVSNFISGLILIFERPIVIGDIVQVDNIEGQVISIGIRSSRVMEYDGSVLIVPNSDLISNKVVNRTLTDSKRRFTVDIHTSVDVEIETVLYLMTRSVDEVPDVLPDPPAKSYFLGTEGQAKLFRLYFWVSNNILATKSQVNIQVHKALADAGIKVMTEHKVELVNFPEKES